MAMRLPVRFRERCRISIASMWAASRPTCATSGRSGCCAGVDQIVFDVPAGVSGCYVPVAAITGGVVSNFGTISVSTSGKECDDPQSYRASDLTAAERGGGLRAGQVGLSGTSGAEVNFSAGFFSADLNALLAATGRLKPALGSCYIAVARVGDNPTTTGKGLNAGNFVRVNGPVGQFAADNTTSGNYFASKAQAQLSPGSYSFSSSGGSDVGPWSATLNMSSIATWSNFATFNVSSYSIASPFTFTWTGGDPNGSVTLRVASANAIYNSSIECTVSPAAGRFTIPAFLSRVMYSSPATISFTYTGPAPSFTASGIDVGVITSSITTSAQTTLAAVQ